MILQFLIELFDSCIPISLQLIGWKMAAFIGFIIIIVFDAIEYHIVWCVKYRRKVLTPEVERSLLETLKTSAADNGFTIDEAIRIWIMSICSLLLPRRYLFRTSSRR